MRSDPIAKCERLNDWELGVDIDVREKQSSVLVIKAFCVISI